VSGQENARLLALIFQSLVAVWAGMVIRRFREETSWPLKLISNVMSDRFVAESRSMGGEVRGMIQGLHLNFPSFSWPAGNIHVTVIVGDAGNEALPPRRPTSDHSP
jgi:hypothetical protein